MERILEPELMDDAEQAKAYAAADFSEPHSLIINQLKDLIPPNWNGCNAIDLGCGSGDMSIRLAKLYPNVLIDGLDGARSMLDFARQQMMEAKLSDRIHLIEAVVPTNALRHSYYDLIISNSLLHHLHQPYALWSTICDIAKPNAFIFVADLIRVSSEEQAKQMVEMYASGEASILQRDFYNSLLAAFTLDEVKHQLNEAKLGHLEVRAISDRHQIIYGCL